MNTPRCRAVIASVLIATTVGAPALFATAVSADPPDATSRRSDIDVRPWLGVAMDTDTPGPGARVAHVIHQSPADKGGIREGDRIVRIDRTPIVRGGDVVRAVSVHLAGENVAIAFVRAGLEERTRATLASFPSRDTMMRMDLVGSAAPTWKDVESVTGMFPSSIGALRGRVVLIDFWATWCGPCRVAVPRLAALQAQYGAQGLTVLGVSTEDARDVTLFAERMPLRYAVAVDKHAEMTRSYGVASLPTLVVVDKQGVVRDVSIGYDPSDDGRLERTLRSLLAEVAPTN